MLLKRQPVARDSVAAKAEESHYNAGPEADNFAQ
jgi:hypothetical protein